MRIEYEFINTIATRYLVEFIITVASIKLATSFINSKLFLIILYVFYKFKLPFFLELHSPVINHRVFNTIHEVRKKTFLKYVVNTKKRDMLSVCMDGVLDAMVFKNLFFEQIIPRMLFSKREGFVSELTKNLTDLQMSVTNNVMKINEKLELNPHFVKKFLVYSDTMFHFAQYRVRDFAFLEVNNYTIFIKYLYLINDLLQIFTDYIPLVVNSFSIRERRKTIRTKKGVKNGEENRWNRESDG
jgi:hypothetical protein